MHFRRLFRRDRGSLTAPHGSITLMFFWKLAAGRSAGSGSFSGGEMSDNSGRDVAAITSTLGANQQYCSSCGKIISNLALACPYCGAPTGRKLARGDASEKSRLAALLLCWFFGMLGVHRFYVGKIGTGLLQLFTLGCLGIWTLIDLILIIVGSFTDQRGKKLTVWVD
jgi:TM2 domain-containing membrane protein YozV